MIVRIIAVLAIATACVGAPIDWPHLKLTPVANGLEWSVCIMSARDGTDRLFIAERSGKIRVVVNGEVQPEPFLDISSKLMRRVWYEGVLGLAFPSNFAAKRYFYVQYTAPWDVVVLSRFHVPSGSSVAVAASEEVVMTTRLSPFVGHLEFGPDGNLYTAFGGESNDEPQRLYTLGGKMLRVDTESTNSGYLIPADNPFAGNSTGRSEIWAWGLGLPWSFTFDRLTGDLYLIDKRSYNCEINYRSAGTTGGVNYGYPTPEQTQYLSPDYARYNATPPIFVTADDEKSVGGVVYRGPQPSRMTGIYIFGGHGFSSLKGLGREGTNWVQQDFPEILGQASVFGEDDSGRLYMLVYEGGQYALYRIEDSGKACPPKLLLSGVIHTDVPALASITPGARIRYTTDGRDPATGDPEILSGQTITISTGMTVKAQALRDDLLPSDISVATYTAFKVAYPIFVPGPGAVPNPASITITSATPGAIIRYTTNGTHPTLASPVYTGPITVPGNAVVYARAYRDGFQDSEPNGATYTWAFAQAPWFTPETSPITNGTWITMNTRTPGAKIRYTLDGTEPTATSLKYTNRIRINGNTTVKAMTFAKGYRPSAVTTVFFELVNASPPVFNPVPGIVPYGGAVQIISPTVGATIRFTTNGSDPTKASPAYSAPIIIYSDTVIKARAFKSQMDPSAISGGTYALPAAHPPAFTPAGPIGPEGAQVVISSQTKGAQIRYTIDGTEPKLTSQLYRRPVYLKPFTTLSAKAYAFGYNPSATVSNLFTLAHYESAIVQTHAGNGQPGWVDGPVEHARFRSPKALCIDPSGTMFVADTENHVIRKIDSDGTVITIAGSGVAGSMDGIGTNATFNVPTGIAVDATGNLYVAEHVGNRIRKIAADGVVTTLATNIQSDRAYPHLWQMEISSTGLLYVGSRASVVTITESGVVSNSVGSFIFCPPYCPARGLPPLPSIGLDRRDTLYWSRDGQLFRVDASGQHHMAGSTLGYSDGPASEGCFSALSDIAIGDDDTVYISDANRIRVLHTNAYLSTLAGNGLPGYRNGIARSAEFNSAAGLCLYARAIYVADAGNHAIRKISFDRDHDTIPDPEDAAVGRDDRVVDSDGDGQSNTEEFWAATDPNDANSMLRVQARVDGSNGVVVSWPMAPGRSYVLASSTNLVDWETLAPVVGDSITNSPTVPRMFYRVRVEP